MQQNAINFNITNVRISIMILVQMRVIKNERVTSANDFGTKNNNKKVIINYLLLLIIFVHRKKSHKKATKCYIP